MSHLKQLTVGMPIEYKYKNKYWNNGVVININKRTTTIKVKINFDKYKQIELDNTKITKLLLSKKKLKISNIEFPQWITNDAIFDIEHYFDYKTPIIEKDYKIAVYIDGKTITFYSIESYFKNPNKIKFIKIKQKNILEINSIQKTILTDKYLIKYKNSS
eukprot:247210_1